jgi:hypothetical protein
MMDQSESICEDEMQAEEPSLQKIEQVDEEPVVVE